MGDKIDSQIEKIRDNTARQKIAVKVLSFVGMIVAVVVAWMGIKLVQSRNIQPSVDPQAKNGDMVGQGEGKAKIAELEEEKKRKESELADIRAESECVKCISDMREKLHSRYGVFGAVDCFNTFCSEHSDAMASSHATNVVRLLHRTIGDEFLRICAVITNQNWQFGLSCGDKGTESHSPDALDKSFQELKELAFKVGRIKNDDAAKSCWIEFAQKCKPWLTRLDEAFALNYEVTKIEAMMDYEEVSKYFWNITFYAPEIVRLKSTEGGLVKWERCDVAPIKLDVDTIKTNRVWQTVWEGSVTTAGNPWRDAGLLMSIRDYGWGRYETTAFVVPLYGAGERKNATDGARVVEKRIRMPLKDNSKSKEPYVRVRVYVNDSAADSSAANLFSLLPDDTKQGRR